MTTDRQNRLNEVAALAVALEAQAGCPATLLVTQWALESAWGARPAGNANYFGIKRAPRHAKYCTVMTREVLAGKSIEQPLEFADYDSLADSARDYAWMITNVEPYRATWQRFRADRDMPALVTTVAKTYATDPGYSQLAIVISKQANVAMAIAAARKGTNDAKA